MKKLTLLCLTLALFAFITGPASAAGPSPDAQAPAAPADAPEPAPGTPCEAPPATAAPDAPAELLGLGLPGDPVPVHGTCGGIQTECRSCPQGIQACDYRICYTSGSGFHKDTIGCTPCGAFC
jgi:hypothetical protein